MSEHWSFGEDRNESKAGRILAKILCPWYSRVVVFLLYFVYLAASINWALMLPLGKACRIQKGKGKVAERGFEPRLSWDSKAGYSQ